jgi:uncharacterized protein YoxC
MHSALAVAASSIPSIVLRYAAAFFFVVVAIAIAYALVKAAKALERVDKVLADVDTQAVPLMQKAGTTLDGVNANLGNVDQITKDVADITDKIDKMATSVEGAVSTPARKAAAFSAGVQSAFSSFRKRDKAADAADDPWSAPPRGGDPAPAWSADAGSAQDRASDAAATAAGTAGDAASAVADAVADKADAVADATADAAGKVSNAAASAAAEA